MPAKKVNLAEVFKENQRLQKPEDGNPAPKRITPSRQKKKHIGGYFDEAVYRQMKIVAAEKGMTTQEVLAEALNAFFQRYEKPPIA